MFQRVRMNGVNRAGLRDCWKGVSGSPIGTCHAREPFDDRDCTAGVSRRFLRVIVSRVRTVGPMRVCWENVSHAGMLGNARSVRTVTLVGMSKRREPSS